MSKICVMIPVFNRGEIAMECVPTTKAALRPQDTLWLFDDGSDKFDAKKLIDSFDSLLVTRNIGIQAQRRLHFETFWQHAMDFGWTHLYLTDCDAIHAPDSLTEMLRIQEKYDGIPLCGYSTDAHVRIEGNTVSDDANKEIIYRRVAPGISYLLTLGHVARIMPHVDKLAHFDWEVPKILGGFGVCRTSLVDHVGLGGERHPKDAGLDGGDRALNPSPYLVAKRAEIAAKLSS